MIANITRSLESLISLRRVPIKIIVITALTSYALQLGAILLGYPLYIIVLYTLLPWLPVLFFEGIWKIKHYNWIAVFAIIVFLQLGHLTEHVLQVAYLSPPINGTLACPPPVDNELHASRAVAMGIRAPDVAPSGFSASKIVQADKATGDAKLDANGNPIVGPPACGIFGQLDLEIVHLVWDGIGWIATLWLLTKFPRNIWLWIAAIVSSIHTVEHLFISWIFFADNANVFNVTHQLWATTVDGKIVTAVPAGLEPALGNFYDAGGKIGIMGRGGLFETLLFGGPRFMPTRPWLHFFYNFLIVVPTVLAFVIEVRHLYDEYLAEAMPELTQEQLVRTTQMLEHLKFTPGEVIIRQGDPADRFYILTKGEVEVLREMGEGQEVVITRLEEGAYFGEMGLLSGAPRTATVRAATAVQVLSLERDTFSNLMGESEMTREELERVMRHRMEETTNLAGGSA